MSPDNVAFLLLGCGIGACLVGAAAKVMLWRSAWSVISGEAIERAKRRQS